MCPGRVLVHPRWRMWYDFTSRCRCFTLRLQRNEPPPPNALARLNIANPQQFKDNVECQSERNKIVAVYNTSCRGCARDSSFAVDVAATFSAMKKIKRDILKNNQLNAGKEDEWMNKIMATFSCNMFCYWYYFIKSSECSLFQMDASKF